MKTVEPLNGHIFVRPIKETKQVGGIDLTSKYDEQDRYRKAEVVFVDADLPLDCCDIVLYDKHNGEGFQVNGELLTVLHVSNIVGKCEK